MNECGFQLFFTTDSKDAGALGFIESNVIYIIAVTWLKHITNIEKSWLSCDVKK